MVMDGKKNETCGALVVRQPSAQEVKDIVFLISHIMCQFDCKSGFVYLDKYIYVIRVHVEQKCWNLLHLVIHVSKL